MQYGMTLAGSVLVLVLFGCAAHTNLEPKGEGEFSASFGIGGPIIEAFETNMPVPYATVGGEYGITGKMDANATVHLLPFAYKVAALDAGVTWYPLLRDTWQPTIGLQPRLLIMASLKQDVPERVKFYPAFSVSSAWGVSAGVLYIGCDVVGTFAARDYDDDAARMLLSPFLGYRWNIGEDLYLFTELKWQGANVRSDQLAVEYLAVGRHGAVTTLFSIQRRF